MKISLSVAWSSPMHDLMLQMLVYILFSSFTKRNVKYKQNSTSFVFSAQTPGRLIQIEFKIWKLNEGNQPRETIETFFKRITNTVTLILWHLRASLHYKSTTIYNWFKVLLALFIKWCRPIYYSCCTDEAYLLCLLWSFVLLLLLCFFYYWGFSVTISQKPIFMKFLDIFQDKICKKNNVGFFRSSLPIPRF